MNSSVAAAGSDLRFGAVGIGDRLPELRNTPTRVQLFRYSAVTWNTHRIHFDSDYAAVEGYPDVLVQSHLHGAFLTRLCTDWMGARGRLTRLAVTVKRFAVPGDVLICAGTVTGVEKVDDHSGLVHLGLEEIRESDATVCAVGTASVALPV
ncbi:acyl dehydratase [Nocardia panacis]|uniref:Acyl dehydratase n=1 Tax=Nocardia panacis TaxID=2340916 RepID=A0A3A4K476_9NOCA|nr:MaoC/PaaZ C-terminal domain-containing protein [Nocardia panacis]RJO75113.1 acyl dehydratase [Nocardia panacis]